MSKSFRCGIHRITTQQKVVALTFDDGPDPLYTPKVLKILAQKQIHATFFDVGKQVEANPELATKEMHDGHIIGSHTYSHANLTLLSDKKIKEEIKNGVISIEKVIGKKPFMFRPPYGMGNDTVRTEAKSNHYKIIHWGICLDHNSLKTSQELADRVISKVAPGVIILVHDRKARFGQNRDAAIAALPIVIDKLKKQGYKFVTIPELLEISTKKTVEAYGKASVDQSEKKKQSSRTHHADIQQPTSSKNH